MNEWQLGLLSAAALYVVRGVAMWLFPRTSIQITGSPLVTLDRQEHGITIPNPPIYLKVVYTYTAHYSSSFWWFLASVFPKVWYRPGMRDAFCECRTSDNHRLSLTLENTPEFPTEEKGTVGGVLIFRCRVADDSSMVVEVHPSRLRLEIVRASGGPFVQVHRIDEKLSFAPNNGGHCAS